MKGVSLRQDLGLKIAALLLSLLLWLHVQSQESTKKETSFTVPLEVVGVPDDLVISAKPPDLTITLKGFPETIDQFNSQNKNRKLRAFADAGNAKEGAQDFRVSLEPRHELLGLEATPRPSVTIEFEGKTEKSFPVEVVAGGEPPAGFELGTAVTNPSEIKLAGPKSKISQVRSVRALLNLSAIRPGKSNSIPVDVLNSRGEAITEDVERFPAQVVITPTLTPAKPVRSILISPRYSGQPAPGYHVAGITIAPNEAVVQGDRARISRLTVLETEPISIDGLRQSTIRNVNLRLPEGVSVQNKQQQVRVTIRIAPDAPSAGPPRGP